MSNNTQKCQRQDFFSTLIVLGDKIHGMSYGNDIKKDLYFTSFVKS